MRLRLGDWQRRSSPSFRPLPIADSGTSLECGGPERSRMKSYGSVQGKRGLKSPSGEENGDGSATLWGSLPLTSPACPLSGTLKGSGGGADRRSLGEGQSSKNVRTWGCHGMKWNGQQKIGSDGRLRWKPYAPVWAKRIKSRKRNQLNSWKEQLMTCSSAFWKKNARTWKKPNVFQLAVHFNPVCLWPETLSDSLSTTNLSSTFSRF